MNWNTIFLIAYIAVSFLIAALFWALVKQLDDEEIEE